MHPSPVARDTAPAPSATPPASRASLPYELMLAALAIVSVGIGVHDFLNPRSATGFTWVDWLDLSIVAVFIVDFIVESRRRGSAWAHARDNWWELPSLIPITGGMIFQLEGFAVVRALRLVRLIRLLRLLRVAGVAARFRSNGRVVARVARRSRVLLLLGAGAVIVALGSVAGHFAERHTNDRLAHYPDALWWALNMFTNVAYVDFQPLTGLGRVIAGILEFLGIAFIGVFAASVTNALIKEE